MHHLTLSLSVDADISFLVVVLMRTRGKTDLNLSGEDDNEEHVGADNSLICFKMQIVMSSHRGTGKQLHDLDGPDHLTS